MKRLLWVIAGLIALLLVAALAIPRVIDLEPLKARWLPVAQEAIGREVSVGRAALSLFPLGVTIRDIRVMDDPGISRDPFLTADTVTIRVAFWPLLRKRIEVTGAVVHEPAIVFIKNERGRWNYETLGPSSPPTSNGGPAEPPKPGAAGPLFPVFAAVRVINGAVVVMDRAQPPPWNEIRAEPLDVNLENLRPGQEARVTLSTRIAPWDKAVRLSGRVQVAADGLAVTSADLQLALGDNDARLIARQEASSWLVRLESNRLDLNELLSPAVAVSDPPAAQPPSEVVKGNGLQQRPAASSSPPWPGRLAVELAINTLLIDQLTVEALQASGTVERETVRIEKATARLFGGEIHLQGEFGAPPFGRPFQVKMDGDKLNVEEVGRLLSGQEPRLTGTGIVSVSLQGTMGEQADARELLGRASGSGAVEIRDGAVLGIDLVETVLRQLKSPGSAAPADEGDRRVPFTTLTAAVSLQNGKGSLSLLQVESEDFTLKASGTVDLVTEGLPLDLRAELRLSEAKSRQFPPTSAVGEFLTTQGRVAIPVIIKGTAAKPVILPDAKLLAKRTGKRLTNRVLNEVMGDDIEKLQQAGESLLKDLLGR